MTNDASTLESVGEDTIAIAAKGAASILSEITFSDVLRDLDLLPPLGWRHLVLNLATDKGEDRIDDNSRWIYAERLMGSVGGGEPQELILVAMGTYQTLKDRRVEPKIAACAALEGGTVELVKAVGFLEGNVAAPLSMEVFEFASKIRHASSQIGNPVIYRKARKPNELEAAA